VVCGMASTSRPRRTQARKRNEARFARSLRKQPIRVTHLAVMTARNSRMSDNVSARSNRRVRSASSVAPERPDRPLEYDSSGLESPVETKPFECGRRTTGNPDSIRLRPLLSAWRPLPFCEPAAHSRNAVASTPSLRIRARSV
jgi:hypothetical protein